MTGIKIRKLAELGVALALAVVLNFIKVYQMPQGGSVSLEMIPIIFIALRWGWKDGFFLGFAYGVLQMILGGYVVHWIQALLDYPLGFGVLGLSGLVAKLFNNNKRKLLLIINGVVLGGTFRLLSHVISGSIFFAEYAPQGINPWIYSLSYNASYIIPEVLITIIVMGLLVKSLSNSFLNKPIYNKEV